MATITTSNDLDQRVIIAAGPVPLDADTQLPIMSNAAWGRKWLFKRIRHVILKAERLARQQADVAVPITDQDLS